MRRYERASRTTDRRALRETHVLLDELADAGTLLTTNRPVEDWNWRLGGVLVAVVDYREWLRGDDPPQGVFSLDEGGPAQIGAIQPRHVEGIEIGRAAVIEQLVEYGQPVGSEAPQFRHPGWHLRSLDLPAIGTQPGKGLINVILPADHFAATALDVGERPEAV